jgi:hypothetical protein
MIRAFLAAVAVAVGVGGQTELQAPTREPAKPPPFVLGVIYHEGGLAPELARVDPLTLERTGGAVRLRLGGGSATASSPDGGRLALGTPEPGVQIIDAKRMKRLGFVKLGGVGWVTFLSWQEGTLFAVVGDETHTTALVVDPRGEQVLQRHRLNRLFLGAAESNGGIDILTSPRRRIGPVKLTVLGGKGATSVAIEGISGGTVTKNSGEEGFRAQQVIPGLAVDKDGRRAFVVSAGRYVADVSLRNLAVRYHELSEPVSLLGRLHNWLEPAAEAKVIQGPQRKAVWLGNGLVAVTGADYSGATSKPAGLTLIDTSDWSIRKLDDETSDATRVGKTLVGFGRRSGLVGYDLQGRKLYRLFERKEIDGLETSGGLVYVYLGAERRAVVDAASGRVLGRAKPGFISIVADEP